MTRRLGVVGSLVLDTIHGPGDAEPVRTLGGIAYALAAFEAGPAPGWSTVPLLKLGEGARGPARRFLDGLDTVASSGGVVEVPEPNNRVELTYGADGERTERLTGGVPGWSWAELAPLLRDLDALYVNLVAGWEIDLSCAREIRASFEGPTWCDLHSLLLGRDRDGVRVPRVPEDWEAWFRPFDYVQVNEAELELLAGEAGRDPWELARELARGGPRTLFVTLGDRGAAWVAPGVHDAGSGAADPPAGAAPGAVGRVPVSGSVEAADPTGCGDVWGMGCFGALLSGAAVETAVAAANRLAARNAGARGAEGLLDDPGPGGRAGAGAAADGGGRGGAPGTPDAARDGGS